MGTQKQSFTVVGVVNGRYNVRVHERVQALDATCALEQVRRQLPSRMAEASPETTDFLAACVFLGSLRCAHGGVNGPWGEDRCGTVCSSSKEAFTVVAVDPALRTLTCHQGVWSCAGTAERDSLFDFYLLATVIAGSHTPVLFYQPRPVAEGKSSRNERVLAMLKYSPHFAQFFGNQAPMHMPG